MGTDKRSAILRAGMELIAENGFHGAPTAKIAEKAGVGIGSIYRYFKNKEDLIYKIHKAIETQLNKMAVAWDADEAPVRECFIRIHVGLCRYLIDNTVEFKFLAQFYSSPYGIAYRREQIETEEKDVFVELFEYGKNQRVIKEMPLEMHCALVFGPMEFIVRSQNAGFIKMDDKMIYEFIESCWDALKR